MSRFGVGINVLYIEKDPPYTIWAFLMYYFSWVFSMYKVPCLFYVPSSMGPSYVHWLLWGLTLVHKMVPYIFSVMFIIMEPSYVHRLLWGLTLLHKMVPYILECHTYTDTIMYTDYCWVLLLYMYKMVPYIYIVSYILLWVHLIYTDYCGVLHALVHEMVPYICGAICTIMVHLML